jgi:signal peptidase
MNTLPVATTPAIDAVPPSTVPRRISFDRLAGVATTGALIVALLLALVAVVVPAATGGTALTVMTGSMTPNLPPGHIAVYYPVNADTLHPGDVIAYQPAGNWTNGVPITHRVTALESTGGHVTSITVKGDANPVPDKPLQPGQVIGKMAYSVPFVGLLQVVGFHLGVDWIRWVLSASLLGYGAFLVVGDLRKKRLARKAAARAPVEA